MPQHAISFDMTATALRLAWKRGVPRTTGQRTLRLNSSHHLGFISNQALATHAKFQEQQHKAWSESNEGKKSYEMATLLCAHAARRKVATS